MSSIVQPNPASSVHPEPLSEGFITRLPVTKYPIVLALVFGTFIAYHFLLKSAKHANFPLLNPAQGFELMDTKRRQYFAHHSGELLKEGQKKFPQQPYNIFADTGIYTVLPPSIAHQIRNEPGLHFMATLIEEMAADVPGFEVFNPSPAVTKLIINVITKYLTKYLNKVTKPLSDEAGYAVEKRFGTSTEWKSFAVHPEALDVVAHLSSRVFLGEEVSRNDEWHRITKDYTMFSVTAAHKIRKYPAWLRQYVHWFSKDCQQVREIRKQANAIILPTIEKRQKIRQEAIQNGEPVPKFDDAIDWFDQEGQGMDYDMPTLQLFLSHSALHTTTDLVVETILTLSHRQELIQELRDEMATVLRVDGWKKTALFNMKLLDSVLKEVQRIKPMGNVAMFRIASEDVKLPDGSIIPKGARTCTSTELRFDPNEYPNPEEFDGHRFLRWRGTEKDSRANLVATSPASMGFGHGNHACPGRFFAANEVKIALCHMLMKYDWQPIEGEDEHFILSGFNQEANPKARLLVRRRENPEIDMESVE